ncbi:acetyltransferase protein [Spatholobus suberectus]|nr:acetyltransferase protein [Spatholobus suberectus]
MAYYSRSWLRLLMTKISLGKNLLEILKHTLSLALFHFYPLAGRLVTQKTKDPSSYTIFVDCNNNCGARFIHATLDMTVSDILSPVDVPPIVQSFFDHHKAANHDGHTMPLLSVKVTELVDGLFIGVSMNHAIGDGASFFNFINTWFEILHAQAQAKGPLRDAPISRHPIHNRWFPDGCSPLINLPFKHEDEFIKRFEAPKLRERFFHFSAESIAKLKARANSESKTTEITSFQSLAAHVWRCITRARHLPRDQRTSCKLAIDNRSRMEPPLPKEYFGNAIGVVSAGSAVGELAEHDLGWAAWKVHLAVANHDDKVARHMLSEWLQSPVVYQLGSHFDTCSVTMTSSPRFNAYGKPLWMWKGVAVLSGYNNKFDGNVRSYPGHEGGGSIDLEMSLSPDAMTALESDEDFMEAVSVASPLH